MFFIATRFPTQNKNSDFYIWINFKHIVFLIKFSDVCLFAILGQHACNMLCCLQIDLILFNRKNKNEIDSLWRILYTIHRMNIILGLFCLSIKECVEFIKLRICLWWTVKLAHFHIVFFFRFVSFRWHKQMFASRIL